MVNYILAIRKFIDLCIFSDLLFLLNKFPPQSLDYATKGFIRKPKGGAFLYINQYLSRAIQFSRASLNGALTQHKNEGIKTLKLDN